MDSGNGLARETWGYSSSKQKNMGLSKNGDGSNNGSPFYTCFSFVSPEGEIEVFESFIAWPLDLGMIAGNISGGL